MSGQAAITALRRAEVWPEPIVMPCAAALGARLDGRVPEDLRASAQVLADACLSAARFLEADAVWISALAPDGGADFGPEFLRDAATRAIAAARIAGLGVVVELRGPLARALEIGGETGGNVDAALKTIKPAMIAEFEAIANLRPDIIVLADPKASPEQADSRALARLYGALKRLAEHYDILKGMCPAQPGMSGPTAPDLAFGDPDAPGSTERARAIAPDWSVEETFTREVRNAMEAARQSAETLIVSGRISGASVASPEAIRTAVQGIRGRA
ncbi:hypothetical protein [Antarcticimicrobium sediminis]|uniref:hypothetical protein n=1 Tax=Antarcticimicrobium sediminis TaxID=2546227 RepID=UPI0014042B07|nr:hypothetical protein [Antarcticimicrobium sediminis]